MLDHGGGHRRAGAQSAGKKALQRRVAPDGPSALLGATITSADADAGKKRGGLESSPRE